MKNYKKNLEILKKNHVYSEEMEHDACGVGLIASTEGKKSRKIVEYGIEALKAVWHRGAVDADGKTGDGAGIHVEIPKDFFIEKVEVTGHTYDNSEICVGMIFLPRNDYAAQENCKTIVESELTKNDFSIYGWRQVPVNPKVLGEKAFQTMPEIIQVLFKSNNPELLNKDLERKIIDLMYKSMVRSHIDYVLPVFGPSLSNKQIETLEKLQYRAARLTTGAMIRTSGDKMYKDLGWETIKTRILFLSLCLFRKIHTNATRPLIRRCLPQTNLQKQVRTRQDKLVNSYYYNEFTEKEAFFQISFFSKNYQTL